MTTEELLQLEQGYKEAKIQHTCVSWFRHTFPEMAGLLFAVPNGGWRGPRAGRMMVYEGQWKGVADLILLLSSPRHNALCIEMKCPRRKGKAAGRQSSEQKEWERVLNANGSAYAVCHGLAEFIRVISGHMGLDYEIQLTQALRHYPLYL